MTDTKRPDAPAAESLTIQPLNEVDLPGEVEDLLTRDPGERYLRLQILGVGGMGEVTLERDRWIGRDVASKTLAPPQGAPLRLSQRRFVRELRIQGQLEHPSVVPVYDFGRDVDGQLFFTMRRVRGKTLREIIDRLAGGDPEHAARYSRRRLLNAFVSVCLAVHYAHSRGVIHRDLKPANIMLGEFGEVYLLDWGIAKQMMGGSPTEGGDPFSPAISRSGAMIGTPEYMSPEQLFGRGEAIDARTDVYALGLILFELLTHRQLHRGKGVPQIVHDTMAGPPVRPSEHAVGAGEVPPEFDDLYARATARDREARLGSAEELAAVIEHYLDGDRDVEKRRQLAREHAQRAARATTEALAAQYRGEDAQALRAEAMRETMGALALDPTQAEATRALAQLLVEVPERMPVEVEEEMERATDRSRRAAARTAFFGFVSYFLLLPFFLLVGVRSWIAPGIGIGLTALAGLFAWWKSRAGTLGWGASIAMALLNAGVVGMMACWLGPFVLVPTAAAISSLYFATQARRGERLLLMVTGSIAVLVPLGLELLGLVPPSFRFEGGSLILLPRAFELPAGATLIGLIYVSITWILFPMLAVGRVRDQIQRAERQLFLHAWQFRRLLGEGKGGPP